MGYKSSLSHLALWLPQVQLRHSRAALLLGVSRNAFPLLGFGGRHTEGEAFSPRAANFDARWTLNESPLKSYYSVRHCSLFLTFYELGRMCVPVYPLWTDLLPGKKQEIVRNGYGWWIMGRTLQMSFHLFQKWVICLQCPTPKPYSPKQTFEQIFHELTVSMR